MYGRKRLYFEPYGKSYLSYGNSYCKATGCELIKFTDKSPSYHKLPLWTGQAIYNWLNEHFYAVEPEVIVFTNSSDFGITYCCLEDYLKFIPKIMIIVNAEVEYPSVIRPNSEVRALQDYRNMMIADRIIFHTESQMTEVMDKSHKYISEYQKNMILKKSIILKTTGLTVGDLEPDVSRRPEKMRILWNHRMSVEKRPEIFLNALKKLRDERINVDFEVVLLAEKTSKQGLNDMIEDLVLSGHIIHQGFVKDRDTYMRMLQSCHVVVSTTLAESFSTSVAEAVACGCKPIVPERLCFPEMFKYSHQQVMWLNDADDGITENLTRNLAGVANVIGKGTGINEEMIQGIRKYDKSITGPIQDKFITDVIQSFEDEIKSHWRDVATDATKRMASVIDQSGYASKKKIMNSIGWGQLERWPGYSLRLMNMGYVVEHGDTDVFFKQKDININTTEEEWEW